jgi:hypothetical protein
VLLILACAAQATEIRRRYRAHEEIPSGPIDGVGSLRPPGSTGRRQRLCRGRERLQRAKCSNATLKGTYLFAQNGVEIKGNDQLPFAIAGYDVFDGNGEVRGVSSGNFGGEVFRKDPFTGTYTVKANCTGTVTFRDGAAAQGDMFIAPDGSKFAFVRTTPEDVSAGIDSRGSAKRVGE